MSKHIFRTSTIGLVLLIMSGTSLAASTAHIFTLKFGDQALMPQAGVICFANGAIGSKERAFLQSRVVTGCRPDVAGSLYRHYLVRMSDKGIIVYQGDKIVYSSKQ